MYVLFYCLKNILIQGYNEYKLTGDITIVLSLVDIERCRLMKGNERRENIIATLKKSNEPVSGKVLAGMYGVSRQVIVQDIALLRAQNHEITSTTTGYVLTQIPKITRVFKVIHTDDQVADELNLIVDYGCMVEDVFVYHKIYGTIRAEMNIKSRKDVEEFMESLAAGKSSLLKNVTSSYHYHTIAAPSEIILDMVQKALDEKGYLAPLQDYEPIDFWEK